jgi:FtsZ-binding cell division protein ZapB
MSELSFGTEVAEEVQTQGGEPSTLVMSASDFAALEERVLRAVNLVKRERVARAEAEERATLMEVRASELTDQMDNLQKEISGLRAERQEIKQRVDRLLAQLDELEV